MAAVDHITAHKAHLPSAPFSWVGTLIEKFKRHRMYRETFNELSALTNRELADLGLNRSMLKRVAYQAAYENN
ncbi:DUF1127 domain-containing protein [Roseobacteraceae bacterium NS-SX3]